MLLLWLSLAWLGSCRRSGGTSSARDPEEGFSLEEKRAGRHHAVSLHKVTSLEGEAVTQKQKVAQRLLQRWLQEPLSRQKFEAELMRLNVAPRLSQSQCVQLEQLARNSKAPSPDRAFAVYLLAWGRGRMGQKFLAKVLRYGGDLPLVEWTAEAVQMFPSPELLSAVQFRILREGDRRLRRTLYYALAGQKSWLKKQKSWLYRQFQEDEELRAVVVSLLAEVEEKPYFFQRLLLSSQESLEVRSAALQALLRLAHSVGQRRKLFFLLKSKLALLPLPLRRQAEDVMAYCQGIPPDQEAQQ